MTDATAAPRELPAARAPNPDAPGPETLARLLCAGRDAAPSLGAPGRKDLSYADLRRSVERTQAELARLGIGRGDRVALLLPPGPELAAAFLGVASGATAAPLNPASTRDELAFALGDVGARALIAARGSAALGLAHERGLLAIELAPRADGAAGGFSLEASSALAAARAPEPAAPDDVALVLHTSGTTARPKRVPLTQRNLCVAAASLRASLALGEDDRCLGVMPLFHIHGLLAALLGSLAAGASVSCAPGFSAFSFASQLGMERATWTTAVPSMLGAALARAGRDGAARADPRLRFLRSCSAALAPSLQRDLEAHFGVPVIEAYGMTEATHQISSNPLPPGVRVPGTVGRSTGAQIALLDADGRRLPPGVRGEIAVRGPSVMRGYEANPEANAAAFVDGWLRTGDEGEWHADGRLRITGRLKEQINRGGEKVSPREIDDVLCEHPSVAQAVTFALPDARLGEEVAAAVVLRAGAAADERALRRFAAQRLSRFKVPRRVVFVAQIPTGATGKLQRIGLAQRLGLA